MDLDLDHIKHINLDDPKFKERTYRTHNWRNYVPDKWKDNWDDFTEREKAIIASMAETQASAEEWD